VISRTRGRATWPAAAAGTAAVTAALALPGGAAYASPNPPPASQGNIAVASGNQAQLPLSLPLNICGVSVAVLATARSGCQGGAATIARAAAVGRSNPSGTGNVSSGSGNTVSAPISVPVNVCGLSVAALGSAGSGCKGGATTGNPPGNPGGPMIPGGSPPGGTLPGGSPPGGNPPSGPGGKHHKHHKHHPHHKRANGGQRHHKHHSKHGGGSSSGGAPHGGPSNGASTSGSSTSGSSRGGTTSRLSTATGMTSLAPGTLPTTGVDLLGILGAGLGCLVAGASALVARRCRTHGQEA
jgi:hypothetical protein